MTIDEIEAALKALLESDSPEDVAAAQAMLDALETLRAAPDEEGAAASAATAEAGDPDPEDEPAAADSEDPEKDAEDEDAKPAAAAQTKALRAEVAKLRKELTALQKPRAIKPPVISTTVKPSAKSDPPKSEMDLELDRRFGLYPKNQPKVVNNGHVQTFSARSK